MTETEKEETMTAEKPGLRTREEAEAMTIQKERHSSRKALMALGLDLRTPSQQLRVCRELCEIVRQLAESIAQDKELLKAHKIRTPKRRPVAASRPVNSLIKQVKP